MVPLYVDKVEPLDAKTAGSRRGGPSFTPGSRLLRALWMIAWLGLARWTPPPFHAWRIFVLRLFGAQIGADCRIHASASVWWPGNLVVGDNVLIAASA